MGDYLVKLKNAMHIRILAVIAVLCAVDVGWAREAVPPGKWWQPEPQGYQHALGLSDDQANRIEQKFQSFLPWLNIDQIEVDAATSALHAHLAETKDDDWTIDSAVERVKVARRRLALTRKALSLQINRLLTIGQRTRLEEVLARTTE